MNQATPGVEIERRFLVKSILRPETLEELPSDRIVQGYLGVVADKMMRVRIKNDNHAILTLKRGKGLRRAEYENAVDLEMGMAALEACTFSLSKTRYKFNGWELDIFNGPLRGLVLLERELATEDEVLPPFPDFLEIDREVTDSMNNLALAEVSTLLTEGANPEQLLELMSISPVPMFVLTGGPCSGKSTSMRELQEQYPELAFVPEVATIVIAHVGIKPPLGDAVGMAKFQRLIYAVQRAFEHAAQDQAVRDGKKAVVVDRGTMDNAAYVEGGVSGLSKILQTTAEAEYARYRAVICLSQPDREVYEQMRTNNPARSESYEVAEELSSRIKKAWEQHPKYLVTPKSKTWEDVSFALRTMVKYLVETL